MATPPVESTLSTLSVDYEGDAPTPSFSEWINWGDDPDPEVDDQQSPDTQVFLNTPNETTTDGIPVDQEFANWKHRACPAWIMLAEGKSLEAGEQLAVPWWGRPDVECPGSELRAESGCLGCAKGEREERPLGTHCVTKTQSKRAKQDAGRGWDKTRWWLRHAFVLRHVVTSLRIRWDVVTIEFPQYWKWAESVDGDGGYWAAAPGGQTASGEHGEVRPHPILMMMPQPNPARQSYDSILHGQWGYRDMDGKVVVLKQEDAQVFRNRAGDDSLWTTSQPETMRHGQRSEQGPDIEDKVSGSESSRETA
ncbi:uncharacterized protein LAESUDRAFT_761187 [Laetiporus sulphureus 93-53]|uniref:Uncharacterized protein n=1 Tax=Laetiporus sulphureus 93-53 TaxID=1314785 RepID=A0A165D8L4_9APHY|nr:uncharacterized protein LAESUDRAFT_761187 [Laetiporus sulphureus 93-53]KZT04336.1 hypothetical protein LAESUDRAFT_761187 [Laetiporus sulphureus 93-53]